MDLDCSQNEEWKMVKHRKNRASPTKSIDNMGKETYWRILRSASKKSDVKQRHIGRLSGGEIREIKIVREVTDRK